MGIRDSRMPIVIALLIDHRLLWPLTNFIDVENAAWKHPICSPMIQINALKRGADGSPV